MPAPPTPVAPSAPASFQSFLYNDFSVATLIRANFTAPTPLQADVAKMIIEWRVAAGPGAWTRTIYAIPEGATVAGGNAAGDRMPASTSCEARFVNISISDGSETAGPASSAFMTPPAAQALSISGYPYVRLASTSRQLYTFGHGLSAGATRQRLRISPAGTGLFNNPGAWSTDGPMNHGSPSPDTQWEALVEAEDTVTGLVQYGTPATIWTPPDVPEPPVFDTTTPTGATFHLPDVLAEGAVTYRLYIVGGPTISGLVAGQDYVWTGGSHGMTYQAQYYAVGSGGGVSAPSDPVWVTTVYVGLPVTPGAPNVPGGSITKDNALVFSPVSFDATWDRLALRLKIGAGAWNTIVTDVTVSTTYDLKAIVGALPANTEHRVDYQAFDDVGQTADGTDTVFNTLADPPEAPSALRFSDVTDTSYKIQFPALSLRATSFTLFQSDTADGVYTLMPDAITPSSFLSVTGRTAGSTKWYKLRANNNGGSIFGDRAGITTDSSAAPTGGGGGGAVSQPNPPTLVAKRSDEADIAQPATWPPGTSAMRLRMDGVDVHTFATVGEGPFTVTGLADFESYDFDVVAESLTLDDSIPSTVLTVVMVSAHITRSWVTPAADGPVVGAHTLLVQVTSSIGLWPTNPVRIQAFGSDLPGVQQVVSQPRWFTEHDTKMVRYQGVIPYGLIARDSVGLYSTPLMRLMTVNNTIQNLTSYRHVRYTEQDGGRLIQLQVESLLQPAVDGQPAWFVDVLVASPPPAGPFDYEDFTEMETELARWQPFSFNVMRSLSGYRNTNGTYGPTTSVVDAIVRFTPERTTLYYATDATSDKKFRTRYNTAGSPDRIEVFTTGPAKVMLMQDSGLTTILDLETRDFEDAIDAVQVSPDKVVAVDATTILIADVNTDDTGDQDITIAIVGEARLPVSVEEVNGVVYLFMADETDSTVHRLKLLADFEDQVVLEIDAPVSRSTRDGNRIAYATDDFKLWDFEADPNLEEITPRLLYAHDDAIVDIYMSGGQVKYFADSTHIYVVDAAGIVSQAGLLTDVNAVAEYMGIMNSLHAIAGGNEDVVFEQIQVNGALTWSPITEDLEDCIEITQLRRMVSTFVPGQGDPLRGGTEPIIGEDIIVGVTTAAGLGYVARVQRARKSDPPSNFVAGLGDLIFTTEEPDYTL